jgi:hypothetical protein
MSGQPASLAGLPHRSTPCRSASAEVSNPLLAARPIPSGIGMAKPTIQQARDRAEVLGRYTPGMGHERRFPGTSVNGR